MTALRQVRGWLAARRRFQFVATVVMVGALTAACGALLLLPKSVLPGLHASDAPVATDPELPAVRQIMTSYGKIVADTVDLGSGHVGIVLGHPAHQSDVDVLAGELAAATDAVTGLWGTAWSQAPVVVVASSPAEFAALTNETGDLPTEVAAATVADPFRPGTRPSGQRVVFGSTSGHILGADGLRSVLRHELTHYATRAITVDGSPLWMLEGAAEYTAHRGKQQPISEVAPTLTTRARAGDIPADLPADTMFGPAGGQAVLAYEQGWSACAFIADRFGDTKLVDLYHRIATGKKDRAATDTIFQQTLGLNYADFLGHWQTWIKTRTAAGA